MRAVFNQVANLHLNEIAVVLIGRVVFGTEAVFVEKLGFFCSDLEFGDGEFITGAFFQPDIRFLLA